MFQWDLVCDKAALVPTVKSLYMAGLMAGVLTFGTLSDAYVFNRFWLLSRLISFWIFLAAQQVDMSQDSTVFKK